MSHDSPGSLRFAISRSFWEGRRVLVTGHTGFKGAWLTYWLTQLGATVRGYALPPAEGVNLFRALGLVDFCHHQEADIRDSTTFRKALAEFQPEVVFHLAAQALVLPSYEYPVETFDVNVRGTMTVLDECRLLPCVRAIVIVTSDKCYENHEWAFAYRENDALGGHDPYSASKACAEIVTSAFARSYFIGPTAAGVASARAGNVIGGGDGATNRLVPDAIRAFAAGRTLELRRPSASRPWQHVLEPLAGYLMLARALVEAPASFSAAWNFGPESHERMTVAAVADRLALAWGEGAAWRDIGTSSQRHEAASLVLDSHKARSQLGWRSAFGVDEAVGLTVAWERARHGGATRPELRELCAAHIRLHAERIERST